MSVSGLPDEFVLPDYRGGSLANIPATVAALLEVPFEGLQPLPESLWRPIANNVRRVVLLLLDSLGWELYQRELPKLEWLARRLTITAKITTVFPSTTVAALSSLWTGYAPAQHGLVGLRTEAALTQDCRAHRRRVGHNARGLSTPGSFGV